MLLGRNISLGLCSRSCKLRQMVASFCARFKVNSKSKKRISRVLKESFSCPKMERVFSKMGANQAHEQNNKVVKADGGAISIFDSESALLE